MALLRVYCDESGTSERYMLYGGIVVLDANVAPLDEVIARWRAEHRMSRELKWSKVSKRKLPEYRSFVDLFFHHAKQQHLHFAVVVFDTRQIDYRRYHRNDKTLGFYRFYHKFLLHKFGVYAHSDADVLRLFLDQRSDLTQVRADTMRITLNRGIRNMYRRSADVVQSVESAVSHDVNLMQLADVLMGAVGYHCNELHKAKGASPARKTLAEHIAKHARLRLLSLGTSPRRPDFNIWRFKFPQEARQLTLR